MPCKLLKRLEARVGIEPTHKGFADPDKSIFNFFSSSTSLQIVHPFVRLGGGWQQSARGAMQLRHLGYFGC